MTTWSRSVAALLFAIGTAAHAKGTYPNQPIKVIVPFPEGSVRVSGTSQQATQFLKTEQQRWGIATRGSNVKLD